MVNIDIKLKIKKLYKIQLNVEKHLIKRKSNKLCVIE